MHLEDVNIEGFKSFSEKTNMSFQPGIDVIIGNNGVGKSNILDAVVWAMGENDLEKLRCHDAEELFFVGSKDYAPAGHVEVELNFREGTGKDAPKTQVIRRMDRDGRETYRIGGRTLDRKQFLAGLEKLSVADALKTIVRQEQINDMLTLEPRRRFQWIEGLVGLNGDGTLPRRLAEETAPQFSRYLKTLFPKGDGALRVEERQGEPAVEIEVTLSGGRARKAHQLSGGEKSVTSLALKLAVFDQLESPFYLLDEVEPSLDYAHHKSMQAFLKALAARKQLIMITHLRSTIELASTLHGVRTRFDGSSFMKFYFVMNERLLRLYKCC